jgi:DNA-binding MarR family transcriptional regulator
VDEQPAGGGPSPAPVGSSLPFVLFGLGRLMERELELRLADQGLSLRTLGVLGHLATLANPSYSDLARRADVTVQTMHTTVRRLIVDGLVAATGTAGQAASLTLTDRGRARLRAAAAVLAAYETALIDDAGVDGAALAQAARTVALSAWRLRTPPDLP